MTAVAGIVGLEVVGGMGNEASQFAGEEHRRHEVTVVVGRLLGVRVADGDADAGGFFDALALDGNLNLLVGLVGEGRGDGCRNQVLGLLAMIDEEQAVGQDLGLVVEEGHVAYARGQFV